MNSLYEYLKACLEKLNKEQSSSIDVPILHPEVNKTRGQLE